MCIAFDLTMPTEEIKRGRARDLLNYFSGKTKVGEFVIVVKGV
jgi:16S rRNA C1402 (ribose-2'-O) methylase RsmI